MSATRLPIISLGVQENTNVQIKRVSELRIGRKEKKTYPVQLRIELRLLLHCDKEHCLTTNCTPGCNDLGPTTIPNSTSQQLILGRPGVLSQKNFGNLYPTLEVSLLLLTSYHTSRNILR